MCDTIVKKIKKFKNSKIKKITNWHVELALRLFGQNWWQWPNWIILKKNKDQI